MPIATSIPDSFARALKAEFPYLFLRWSHERCRWGLWELDELGSEWFDCWIEGPNGEPRDPGDWLLTRLRAATREAQGTTTKGGRLRWIRGLYNDVPLVCVDCHWNAVAPSGNHPNILIDRGHARRCLRCLERAGWRPGMSAHAFKVGYVKRSDRLGDDRSRQMREEARWHAHQGRVFSTRGASSVSDPLHREARRRERHKASAQPS